ncbi:hypothetical protein BDZ89DRAFT_1062121 [Hymenopellis radicata]|nr:hypothetical protein BDZ89DRAFT_1062121 [Hymenopellis radicata]
MGTTSSRTRYRDGYGYPQPMQYPRGPTFPAYQQYPQALRTTCHTHAPPQQFYQPQGFFPQQAPPGIVYVNGALQAAGEERNRGASRPDTGMSHRSMDHASRHSTPVIPDSMTRSHSRVHSSSRHVAPILAPLPEPELAIIRRDDNPLPAPPRNVYDFTPHRQVLSLPETAALLTGAMNDRLAEQARTHKGLKGFFKSRSKKRDRTVYVPVPHMAGEDPSLNGFAALNRRADDSHASTSNIGHASSSHHHDYPDGPHMAVPPPGFIQPMEEPFLFPNGDDSLMPFEIAHPGYPVIHENRTYPTAFHLFEAHKFFDNNRPDLADSLRRMRETQDVSFFVNQNSQFAREDWSQVVNDKLFEVQREKILQHPNLRQLLMSTGNREMIYTGDDQYWGGLEHDGRRGENHMGHSLMRVRQWLRANPSV